MYALLAAEYKVSICGAQEIYALQLLCCTGSTACLAQQRFSSARTCLAYGKVACAGGQREAKASCRLKVLDSEGCKLGRGPSVSVE